MEDFKLPLPEIEAKIYYLTPEEGGRKNKVITGYRGQFYYDDHNWDAAQEFIGEEICLPGGTINVKLQFISPDNHKGKFHVGKEFEIHEGTRVVAKGEITNILREDYKK